MLGMEGGFLIMSQTMEPTLTPPSSELHVNQQLPLLARVLDELGKVFLTDNSYFWGVDWGYRKEEQ